MYLKYIVLLFTIFHCGLSSVLSVQTMDTVGSQKSLNDMLRASGETTTPSPSTEAPTTTSAPTLAPNTTTSSTTPPTTTTSTTTPPTTTTSTTPSTTTTSSTTPSTTTTTSTTPPTTTTSSTTVAPPITTAAPPTPPKPNEWYVVDKNVTCIMVQMLANVTIYYPGLKEDGLTININNNSRNATAVSGTCAPAIQTLNITFGEADQYTLQLQFVTNNDTGRFSVNDTRLFLNGSAPQDAIVFENKENLFTAPLSFSFKCAKLQAFNLTTANNHTAVLSLSQLQLEAFHKDGNHKFGDAQDCADVPDLVPIAVGVSLCVMVIIVLGAYLFGRRPANSYVSM